LLLASSCTWFSWLLLLLGRLLLSGRLSRGGNSCLKLGVFILEARFEKEIGGHFLILIASEVSLGGLMFRET
jgi:hypothetical protein